MEKSKLLLVDDEPNLTSALVRSLDRTRFKIFTADSAQQGLMILAGNDIDVVVSDERMPGMTGSQFLSEVRKQWPNTIRMILSGQADLEAAVRAINEGEVYRFLLKPCHPKELQMTILQGLQHKKLVEQSRRLLHEHQKTVNLLETLEKKTGGGGGGFSSTHPSAKDRIAKLKSEADKLGSKKIPKARTERFKGAVAAVDLE